MTVPDIKKNVATLRAAIQAWQEGEQAGLPDHIGVVRGPWVCGTGKWCVTLGERLCCGEGYRHFVGEGDTPEAAHQAALADMVNRLSEEPLTSPESI